MLPALLLFPAMLGGAGLAQRVADAEDGTIRLSFAARGVCGNGLQQHHGDRTNDEWKGNCQPNPVRVSMRVQAGQ